MKYYHQILFIILFTQSIFSQSITWQKVFPNPPGTFLFASGFGIQPANNGNFYFINSCSKTQVLKINPYGNIIWSGIVDSVSCNTGVTTSDGGYLVTGINNKPIPFRGDFSVKFNSTGNLIWNKTVDSIPQVILKIIKADNNTYVMCGYSSGGNGLILAVDSIGNLKWKKLYPSPMWKNFWTICKAYNGGYLAAGYYSESEYTAWGIITRIDDFGNIMWERKYDTVGTNLFNTISSIHQYNGGYIFTPHQTKRIGNHGSKAGFVVIDTLGNVKRMEVISEDVFTWVTTSEINIINPNRFLICGSVTDSTLDTTYASTIIIDSMANIAKKHIFNESNSSFNESLMINENDFILVGVSYYLHPENYYNAYVVRTDTNFYVPPIGIIKNNEQIPIVFKLLQNYPNPFNSSTVIEYELSENIYVELDLFDILGRKVMELVNANQKRGKYGITVEMNNISTGVYFYSLKAGNFRDNKKLVLVK